MKQFLKQVIQVFILFNMVFNFIMVFAPYDNYQIDRQYDDIWWSEVGTEWFETAYIPLSQSQMGVIGALAFRNLSIDYGDALNEAILSIRTVATSPPDSGDDVWITIRGIATGDLDDWTPPNNVWIQPQTIAFVNVNVTDYYQDTWVNITVTEIVREIIQRWDYDAGNDLGFKITSIADSPARWLKAYDSIPSHASRLYLTYNEQTPPTSDDTQIEDYRNITIYNRTIGEGFPFLMGRRLVPAVVEPYFIGWSDSTVEFNESYSGGNIGTMLSWVNDVVQWVGSSQYVLMRNATGLFLWSSDDNFLSLDFVETIALGGQQFYPDMHYSEDSGYLHIVYGYSTNLVYLNYSVPTQNLSTPYTIVSEATAIDSVDSVLIREGGIDKLYVAMAHEVGERFTFQQKINASWSNQYSDDLGFTGVGNLQIDYLSTYDTFCVARFLSSGGNDRIYFTNKTRYSAFGNWQNLGAWDEITPWDDKASDYTFVANSNDNVLVVAYASLDDATRIGISVTSAPSFIWTENVYSDCANFSGDIRHPMAKVSPEHNQIWISSLDLTNDILYDAPWTFYDDEHTILQNADREIQDTPNNMEYSWGSKHYEGTSSFRIVAYDNGTLINNTCMDTAYSRYTSGTTTFLEYLDEVKACIDAYIGYPDPLDPNPPASSYPPTGIFMRMKMRFGLFLIAMILIFGSLSLMAWRTFEIHWYPVFIVAMLLGLGLLWSVGSI